MIFFTVSSLIIFLYFSPTKAPDRGPADLQVWTPHSTALHVRWNEVPDAYRNGVIRGYKVYYLEANSNGSSLTEDVPSGQQSLSITGLKKFTLYNVTVLAYTSKGDGAITSEVLMTDQDGMPAKVY